MREPLLGSTSTTNSASPTLSLPSVVTAVFFVSSCCRS